MAMPSSDTDELAKFGYKQELDRSLGLFSSFAAGFSYISIMTGVFELFFFGFGTGGPAFIWTWPAELAGQYPLAGSVYQWAKQIARPFTAFFGGWILSVGAIVTLAAVAVAYQVVAPQISSAFQIIGGPSDIGRVAGRGDPGPAEERPARDPARADRGRGGRVPRHLVRRDVDAGHPRQGTRHLRAPVSGQGDARRPDRQPVPDRLADRDHRVQPGRARRRDPDDLHDGTGRAAAVRLGHREGARQVQDAAGPVDRHRPAHDPAAGAERR